MTVVLSAEPSPDLDGEAALARHRAYEADLIASSGLGSAPAAVQHLALAADQFIVQRSTSEVPDGCSVIAGYPWFGDWGRDTMIALPGLCLATGRSGVAARVLRTFARFADRGMVPNRFPDTGETPEYNTADATLWYVEAVRAYHAATGDDALLGALFPVLAETIDWHERGTRHGIQVDPHDGLLYAGEAGLQLTWMDAKVGNWVVTPRQGKPVEVNALWYNALCSLAHFARRLGKPDVRFREAADRARRGFRRFWNADFGYPCDVLDGPDGDDAQLRPNALFTVSLPHSPFEEARQKAIVDVCARHLLTPLGLRSLAPEDPAFTGHYGGDGRQRDGAYHQGTVWCWLIGSFVTAHLRVYRNPAAARAFLFPLLHHLTDHGVGSLSEICDGDAPFTPRGCPAQAWSVAEVLRAWRLTTDAAAR